MSAAIRVLIVDDDFRVAGLHRDLVAARPGFEVLDPVGSVGEARRALETHRPQLVLADVYLPDGDGIELVRSLDVDAIVISAVTDAATIRRALRAGAVGYVQKPFDRRAFERRLDRYARARNLLHAADELAQDDIDRALAVAHGTSDAVSVARGATEAVVLGALEGAEASATEVAERIGASRATAQRHLAALAARGDVEVRLQYGSTGRPEHLYRIRAR